LRQSVALAHEFRRLIYTLEQTLYEVGKVYGVEKPNARVYAWQGVDTGGDYLVYEGSVEMAVVWLMASGLEPDSLTLSLENPDDRYEFAMARYEWPDEVTGGVRIGIYGRTEDGRDFPPVAMVQQSGYRLAGDDIIEQWWFPGATERKPCPHCGATEWVLATLSLYLPAQCDALVVPCGKLKLCTGCWVASLPLFVADFYQKMLVAEQER
jgi:hypothetical protein